MYAVMYMYRFIAHLCCAFLFSFNFFQQTENEMCWNALIEQFENVDIYRFGNKIDATNEWMITCKMARIKVISGSKKIKAKEKKKKRTRLLHGTALLQFICIVYSNEH